MTKTIKRVNLATGAVQLKGEPKAMLAMGSVSSAVAKTPKAPNYTPEQTTKMVADYTGGVTVEAIAKELGKSVRSIVAKLSREKVYKAKTYLTKANEKPVKKDELADQVGALAQLTESETESLTKVNKTALKKIIALMTKPVSAVEAQTDAEFEAAEL